MREKIGRKIPVVLYVLLLLLSVSTTAFGQGFPALLEKLDKLEARLDQLETRQQKEIQNVQSRLQNIPEEDQLADVDSSLAVLQTQVDDLKEVAQTNDEQLEQYDELTGDLHSLVGNLRETILESTNPEAGQALDLGLEAGDSGPIPLEISGFGDIYASYADRGESSSDFAIGQLEIDLETNFEKKIIIGAAVAYDAEAEAFGLGAFTVDIHLFDTEGGHFRPVAGIDHSGILVGQFDIPFGIDWEEYASIDRRLVSAPLAVELTHHAWNDYGVQGYLDSKWFNAAVFGVNGFGYQAGYHTNGQFLGYEGFGYDIWGDSVEVRDFNVKSSGGGRFGLKPFPQLEIGSSWAGFINDQNKNDMSLWGTDLRFSFRNFSLRAEYIVHQLGQAGDNPATNSGYYGTGGYDFGRFYLAARYSGFESDIPGIDNRRQISSGGGWVVRQGCELRVEYQANSEDGKNAGDISFLQLVVGF